MIHFEFGAVKNERHRQIMVHLHMPEKCGCVVDHRCEPPLVVAGCERLIVLLQRYTDEVVRELRSSRQDFEDEKKETEEYNARKAKSDAD